MLRFYAALLRLYPAGFRAEYRHELMATFAERVRGYTGPLAPLRIALAAVADVIPNALAEHWEILRQDMRYAVRSLARRHGGAHRWRGEPRRCRGAQAAQARDGDDRSHAVAESPRARRPRHRPRGLGEPARHRPELRAMADALRRGPADRRISR